MEQFEQSAREEHRCFDIVIPLKEEWLDRMRRFIKDLPKKATVTKASIGLYYGDPRLHLTIKDYGRITVEYFVDVGYFVSGPLCRQNWTEYITRP